MPLSQNMDLVTYVSQENFLFRKSILENMRFAKADASLEEVQEACRKASCHDFITSLPNGYDTVAATAYSDPDNEAEIQRSINELIKSKTVIMIAHRLSTIINADNILVIDKGRIESQGTHKELLSNSPVYKELWEAHMGADEKGEVR